MNTSDIPSPQPRAERPANNVNVNVNHETQPPPPNDDDDDPNGPHDTSEALLLPDEDLEKLKALHEKWTEIFNLDHPWDEFCTIVRLASSLFTCWRFALYISFEF